MILRRLLIASLTLLFTLRAACAQSATTHPSPETPMSRGLSYLSRNQNPDGSFGTSGPKIAISALCLMSFLSSGQTPDVGKYGEPLRQCTNYLVRCIPDDGYVGRIDGSRMYGQGIVTLALAEVYGVDPSPESRAQIRASLTKAVKVILDAQNVKKIEGAAGGWRYEPQSPDSDLSLSAWNALALRAARDIGVDIPGDPIDRAIGYIGKCYRADQHGFAYQPGADATASMTAVAILSLSLLENRARPEVPQSARLLLDNPITPQTKYPCYAAYYVTQAAHRLPPEIWGPIWQRTHDRLIAGQLPDGSWPASSTAEEPGPIYSTALSLLTLGVPQAILPIYQH